MTHERSDRAWEAYRESANKLDYFMLGLAGALTGYLGKDLTLVPLGLNAPTAELASIVSFAASMVTGFKRVEWSVSTIGSNHSKLHQGESAGALVDMAKNSSAFINLATGDVLRRRQ